MSKPWILLLELTRRDAEDMHSALCDAGLFLREQAPNMGPTKEARYLRDAKRYEELAMMLFERMTK